MNLFENLQIMKECNDSEYNDLGFDSRTGQPFGTHYDVDKPEFDFEDEELEESKIIKDEKDIEQVVENTALRPFDSRDHAGWGGVHNFADGSEPMIVDGEFATILVGQSDEQVGTEEACISIYYGDPEADSPEWGFKCYDDKESAIKDAKILAKLADDEVDVNQLKRFGFEIVA